MSTLGLVVGFILCGIAVKHAAYILINGSVFEWLRSWIRKSMVQSRGAKKAFFTKLYDLFTCNLCMTTQVSLWMISLPTIILVHARYVHPLEKIVEREVILPAEAAFAFVIWFIAGMAMGGFAYFLWNILEYPAQMVKLQERLNDEIRRRNIIAAGGIVDVSSEMVPTITPDIFPQVLKRINQECEGIWCPRKYYHCIIGVATLFSEEWWGENAQGRFSATLYPTFEEVFRNAVVRYREEESWRSENVNSESELQNIAERLCESVNEAMKDAAAGKPVQV